MTRVKIPATWKPALERLYTAQGCLAGHNVASFGGPAFGVPRSRTTPVGELITFDTRSTRPTAFIGFYVTARAAKRAEQVILKNVRRVRGRVERRGAVTVFWPKSSSSALRAIIDGCAFP